MEHILQVAFEFDDEAVKKKLENQCFKEVVDKITSDYKKVYADQYKYNGYSRWPGSEEKLNNQFEQAVCDHVVTAIDGFCESHKDEIINLAADKLADRLSRTKKAKEILNEL